ncbi:MAG: hypothetical protein M3R04_06095 [bacterium]|nr:hypothetical protein [bacterium]
MTIDLQPALLGILIAGILGLVASVVRGAMFNRSEHNVRRHESRSSFLQSQISELYSPLMGHLSEIQTYHDVLRLKLAELDARAVTDPYTPVFSELQRQTLCARFAEAYFDPQYREIALLLRGRRHLIAEDSFPQYMSELQRFAINIEASRAARRELGEADSPCSDEYVEVVRAALPQVEATLAALRQHYRRHLRTLGRLHWGKA